ncbi:MAG: hypothetical protein U9Q04_05920 [Campylobacterota bacterium]|nr:hypothetical protein [Campylobacterota bacterium]
MKILKFVNNELVEDIEKAKFLDDELQKYETIHLVRYGSGEKKIDIYSGKDKGAVHKYLCKFTLSDVLIYIVIPSDKDLMNFLKEYHSIIM